jgi:NADP-dependent 3-hydroxy acid dehydrogenase YdfG
MSEILSSGNVALVTGASSGIGAATARHLVARGLRVIGTGRSLERLKELADELGESGLMIELDVRNEDTVAAALADLPAEWREIDILVNNAGHDAGGWQEFQDLDRTASDDVINTNVTGLIRMTSHVIPGMLNRNRGHIVNIGSISSFTPYPKSAVYCASKFAVDGFTQSLRMDMANNAIRVTQIDPGVVLTGFQLSRYKGDQAAADAFIDSYPTGLTPDDVARAICFSLEQPPGVMIDRIVLQPTQGA